VAHNSIITGGLFTFLFAWSDFLLASTLAGKTVRPVTLGVYQYITSYVTDWSTVMATAVLASLPALVLLVIAQRFIAAGITGGATKA
jgi:multiple sugar transport system permease protein